VKPSQKLFQLVWDQFLLPRALKKYRIDLVHNTRSATSIFNPCYSVVTIHDAAPLIHPKTEKLINRLYWRFQIPLAAKHADRIITVSDPLKRMLQIVLIFQMTK